MHKCQIVYEREVSTDWGGRYITRHSPFPYDFIWHLWYYENKFHLKSSYINLLKCEKIN